MPLTQSYQHRLFRAFTHVDEKGRVFIPDHIRLHVGMKPEQLVEIQIIGGSSKRQIIKLTIKPEHKSLHTPKD
jgi:bifunctional DNA-binding transcriptional regulator/antitoxin component of YhaV-PrlF toxin-antitoxin module